MKMAVLTGPIVIITLVTLVSYAFDPFISYFEKAGIFFTKGIFRHCEACKVSYVASIYIECYFHEDHLALSWFSEVNVVFLLAESLCKIYNY